MTSDKSQNDAPVTDAELERFGLNTGGYDSEPTYDEIEYIKQGYCEACKGMWWMEETGCYETCEGFADELAELRAQE